MNKMGDYQKIIEVLEKEVNEARVYSERNPFNDYSGGFTSGLEKAIELVEEMMEEEKPVATSRGATDNTGFDAQTKIKRVTEEVLVKKL